MRRLIIWLARDEIRLLQSGFEAQLLALKKKVDAMVFVNEKLEKENEELEKKITGLEAVIAYAKDLHEQMFGIIKSFAPRQYPDALSQVGGVKNWSSVQKTLEQKNRKE